MYSKFRLHLIFNTTTFIGNTVIALGLTFLFSTLEYEPATNFVFFLTILSIGLWLTDAIPPFAVGIFIIVMLLLGYGTDYIFEETAPIDQYISTWTSNVIWLLLGGFFLAKGMSVAQLDSALFRFTIKRFGEKPEKLLLGLMLTTAFASMIMSNTATTAMMITSVIPLILILGKEAPYSRALLIGIPAAASVGGIGTIIGSTPNAIAVGALQESGIHITFAEWMAVGFPLALLLVFIFWHFLLRRYDVKNATIDLSALKQKEGDVNKLKQRTVIFILVITILLWLTEPLHGIPLAATSAVPILLLTLTKVVSAEHVRSLPWDTLMLVAGGLALGIALVESGLAGITMEQIRALPLPIVAIVVAFAFISVLLSNVMSNTAAAAILVPLALTFPAPYGLASPVIVAISCSCALFLPVSTPPNAISYATGLIEQKEFRAGGLLLILAGPLIAFSGVMVWSLFYL